MLVFFTDSFLLYVLGCECMAWCTQNFVVPEALKLIGKNKFVEAQAMVGCMIHPINGITAVAAAVACGWFNIPMSWAFPVTLISTTLASLAWLRSLEPRAGTMEWKLEDERIIRISDGIELRPLFVDSRSWYTQTDAFNGYSIYVLMLHDENGLLATNGYRSEEQKDADFGALLQAAPHCRAMSLTLVRRIEVRRWQVHSFFDDWTPLLCGPLTELPLASREWWRQWLYPSFGGSSQISIDPQKWRQHLDEIRAAYPNYWSSTLVGNWDFLDRIYRLLEDAAAADQRVWVMTDETYYKSAKFACGGRVILTSNLEDSTVELEPM